MIFSQVNFNSILYFTCAQILVRQVQKNKIHPVENKLAVVFSDTLFSQASCLRARNELRGQKEGNPYFEEPREITWRKIGSSAREKHGYEDEHPQNRKLWNKSYVTSTSATIPFVVLWKCLCSISSRFESCERILKLLFGGGNWVTVM